MIYEMATGAKAFDGKSHASLSAAILEREPLLQAQALEDAYATGVLDVTFQGRRDCEP